MMYVWLLIGFALLIKGADFFVDGSSSVAKKLRVPGIIIGLTIVAFGTSAPELAVSLSAAVAGNNEIAVGNVIGSNIFNLLIVAGTCGAIMPMAINRGVLHHEFPFSILVSAVLLVLVAFDGRISRIDGVILLVLFLYFLYDTFRSAKQNRTAAVKVDDESSADAGENYIILPNWKSAVYIIGGLAGIVFGGDLVVDSASEIAAAFGLSQTLIGLTIVAMGTSLPELVTSVVASKKGESGMALGNVIGSNIFNILMILSASALITPITVSRLSVYDLLCLMIFNGITWLLARGKYEISRKEGISMIFLYGVYMAYIIIR